jgi:hypothetical protein
MPPWLWPSTETSRPLIAAIRRIAKTVYSTERWMSTKARSGSSTVQVGIPRCGRTVR